MLLQRGGAFLDHENRVDGIFFKRRVQTKSQRRVARSRARTALGQTSQPVEGPTGSGVAVKNRGRGQNYSTRPRSQSTGS